LQYNHTTFLNKKKTLKELISIVGNVLIQDVTPDDILHNVLIPQPTPSLYNERRKHLSAFFEHARKFHGLKYNPVMPIGKIPRERENEPMPTHGELARLLLNMKSGQDKNMIIIYSECGARKEEGLRLTWSDDIDFNNKTIRLIKKN
jgi:integrase